MILGALLHLHAHQLSGSYSRIKAIIQGSSVLTEAISNYTPICKNKLVKGNNFYSESCQTVVLYSGKILYIHKELTKMTRETNSLLQWLHASKHHIQKHSTL